MRHLALLIVVCLLVAAACGREERSGGADLELARLAAWMTGSFSSAAQAKEDPDYFDIRLEMVRIWPEREDGFWLYVEQATAEALERPYRQRVYHLLRGSGGELESRVYELPDPVRYRGAFREEAPLQDLGLDKLEPREGCTVYLRWDGNAFTGKTKDEACASNLNGAAWATSEVTVHPDRLVSWDRGFDEEGKQVWGATKGGYVFVRR